MFFSKVSPYLIGKEASASTHHWVRKLGKLGHEVRLIPAVFVKPYVKRQKNDATDAEAICDAVTRPTMRFVPEKSEEKRAVIMMHRAREQLVRQRTMTVNSTESTLLNLAL